MKVSDVVDLLTPLVLIPIYYLLLFHGASKEPDVRTMIIFMVLTSVWVLGQGMHLAANSIGHWSSDTMGNDINQVIYFYDELLGHFIWHLGVMALSAQLILREWKYPLHGQVTNIWQEVIAGVLYGFTIAGMGLEGNTVPLMFPFAILAAILCVILGRGQYRQQKLITFFLIGYGFAVLGFTVWGIIFHGFPPPTEVGFF